MQINLPNGCELTGLLVGGVAGKREVLVFAKTPMGLGYKHLVTDSEFVETGAAGWTYVELDSENYLDDATFTAIEEFDSKLRLVDGKLERSDALVYRSEEKSELYCKLVELLAA